MLITFPGLAHQHSIIKDKSENKSEISLSPAKFYSSSDVFKQIGVLSNIQALSGPEICVVKFSSVRAASQHSAID